ncbi:MAG: HYR domain-containing protein [Lewinellaceae bacterium]|nr:HYR domain-containing protein [Lewinellaceae bacterium]
MKSARLTLACMGLFLTLKIYAQCPPQGMPLPGNNCPSAPVFCGNLDGYCATVNNNNPTQAFPGCTGFQLNNDEWLAFFAGSTTITLRITPSNCTVDSVANTGLQGGIYSVCGTPWIPKDLQCVCTESPFILSANNFEIGQLYHLVIDGCGLNTCDFSIEVLAGSTLGFPPADPGPITGPAQVCRNSISNFSILPVVGAGTYSWTLTPADAGIITGSSPDITVAWGDSLNIDTALLCVTTSNVCFANTTPSCTPVALTSGQAPTLVVSGGGVLCAGTNGTADVVFEFTGTPPWLFSYQYNGIPQPPILTSENPYVLAVNQPGVYSPQNVGSGTCAGAVSGFAPVTESNITASFTTTAAHCGSNDGGISLTVSGGNPPYSFLWSTLQTTDYLGNIPAGAYSVTISDTNGCSRVLTIQVPYVPTAINITCPPAVQVLGGLPAAVSYDLPVATSDCACPGVALALTEGPAPGNIFQTGATQVCYTAKDSCGGTASCCFEVNIPEIPPCSAKTSGCVGYELLDITLDASGNKRYRFRVRNNCPEKLIYSAFQLPNGAVAVSPPDNSVYTSPAGRQYVVRNPNNSPFYSIRFQSLSDSIAGGESDIFEYTLKPQSQPSYIHVTSRIEPQVFYDVYLGAANCPVQMPPPAFRAAPVSSFRIFPNPVTGVLYADLSAWQEEEVQIQVFDSRRQRVFRFAENAGATARAISLPAEMANGLYFFEVVAKNGERQVARFVLMR